jgi:Xaa-Pro aminopeptidase
VACSIPPALAFDLTEYSTRHTAVRAAMATRGLDVLVVTSPANICYLTGYAASWFAPRLPIGVVVHQHAPELVFVDWTRHADYVPLTAIHDELELVEYGSAPAELAAALKRREWHCGTVGLEWNSPTPTAAVVSEVANELRTTGADVVSGDYLVDDLRVYKSSAEMGKIRTAGLMLDEAFSALREMLRPGLTELEVASAITGLLAQRGSEVPAQHALVSSGPTAWADVHAFPSRREIQRGEVVSVDACAVVDRYHVNLCRSFVIGGWNAHADDYLRAGADSLAQLCRAATIGEGPETALAQADRVLRSRVPAAGIWWIGGYALGIAFPPSWVGHVYLANDGPNRAALRPGYVSNFETIMFNREKGFEASSIDTVVGTDGGLAALSQVPRELLRA